MPNLSNTFSIALLQVVLSLSCMGSISAFFSEYINTYYSIHIFIISPCFGHHYYIYLKLLFGSFCYKTVIACAPFVWLYFFPALNFRKHPWDQDKFPRSFIFTPVATLTDVVGPGLEVRSPPLARHHLHLPLYHAYPLKSQTLRLEATWQHGHCQNFATLLYDILRDFNAHSKTLSGRIVRLAIGCRDQWSCVWTAQNAEQ